MNSELFKYLEMISKTFHEKMSDLETELERLNSISDKSREDKSKIKEIEKILGNAKEEIDEIDESLSYYKDLTEEIQRLEKEISSPLNGSTAKSMFERELDSNKQQLAELEKSVEEDYHHLSESVKTISELNEKIDDLEKSITNEEDRSKKEGLQKELDEIKAKKKEVEDELISYYTSVLNMKENKKEERFAINNKAISIAALLLALGLGFGLGSLRGCSKSNKTKTTPTTEPTVSNTLSPTPTPDPTVIPTEAPVEELGFVDISDEEQVYERASEFVAELDTMNPGHDYSVDEIANIMRWINGGKVEEEPNPETALFAVTRLETLMNRENQREVEKPFDISKLFIDGSQGQKLASKIYDIRAKLMSAKTEEEYRKYSEEFTSLLVESWVLNGVNNEVSAYALETSFMEALVDKYFLNTYASINAENIVVTVSEVEFSLDEVADEINAANCPAEVTADNGETFTTYVNKFSSDMIGAVKEATINKESKGLKLTIN